MSAQLTFWYKRYEKVPTKDDKGIITGYQIVEAEDCINLYDVSRGFWKEANVFCLMMKDAHEESREVELHPKVREEMRRNNKLIPKERVWLMSQIDLHGVDILRYRAATELAIQTANLPEVVAPHFLKPPKPPEVKVSTSEAPQSEPTLTSTEPAGMTVVRQEPEPVQQSEPKEEPTLTIVD